MAKSRTHNSPKRPARQNANPPPPPPQTNSFPIVGIGASAGGLEAVTQFLKALPADTGLSLVLVQHLDPTHESALTSILARSTRMPVSEARHNVQLAPNHLYVIPPNKLMSISQGRLKLSPRQDTDGVLAVDQFFRTLAECEGNRAIGVVFSGNGSDGTQGCLAIKSAGGITFAQEEKTAKYPAMPGSAITAGCVDFVLAPDGIARELARLAGHPYIAPKPEAEEAERPADERALEQILLIVRQRTHVDFSQYKPATLKRRIQRRMALQKLDNWKEYGDYLRAHPSEAKELYNDILIHVTGFFRDPAVFQLLKKKFLPRIVKHKAPEESVRIWVPGCSTGEEVYSLAITVLEYLGDHKLNHPVQIFGTDIHDAALAKARAGFYPPTIRTDLSTERLRRFFTKTDGGYRINKRVREMCIFARQNVVVDPPFSNIDLVSCRNLLIYLGQSLQRKAMPLFHYALRSDAFLLLGASETIGGFVDLFALADNKAKIYVKKATRNRPVLTFAPATAAQPAPASVPEALPQPGLTSSLFEVQRQADRILLSHFTPAGVVINRHMEVLQFRGHTGPFLEHSHGEASLNLLKMAREGLAVDLRTAVTRAFKQGTRVKHERARARQNGEVLELSIEVLPFSAPPAIERFCLVLFRAPVPAVRVPPGKRGAPKPERPHAGASPEQMRLEEELAATRESLQAIIEEQEATNEELRSANEEIMSSNEELQSTNEELETAKEELQSTNEELTTLNDELEGRNVELETLNNDLYNLLASVNIPIIILSQDLRIRRFTGMAERTFNLIPTDVGRPIADINLPLNLPELGKQVVDVLDNLGTKEMEVKDKQGHWWQVRIRPYKTMENKIDGAIIAMLDIDVLKNNVQLANQGRAFAEAVLETVRRPMLALDQEGVVQFINQAFCEAFKLSADQVLHQPLFQVAEGRFDAPGLRKLLQELLPREGSVRDYEVKHDFPGLGLYRLRLNARRLVHTRGEQQLTLLAVETMEPDGKG